MVPKKQRGFHVCMHIIFGKEGGGMRRGGAGGDY